jgi:putative ABC transport system permease protein
MRSTAFRLALGRFGDDVRVAARLLARARGFTATVVITLATALALQASVVAVVNAYLIRSLPYPAADRLYQVSYARPGEDAPEGLEDLDWTSLSDVVEHPVAWDLDVFYMSGGEYPEAAPGAWVTPGFMQGLGIRPAMGRGFSREDFQAGQPQVALISHGLWQTRYSGDSAVIGRTFQAYVSDRPRDPELFTIVGVLAEHFWHFNPYTQVLTPLRAATYPYIVRLRADVPPAVVERRITSLVTSGARGIPPGWQARLLSSHEQYASTVKPMLFAVGAAVTVVLLIVTVNVALLALLRGMRRQKEIAVRLALGAKRAQVARLLLAESLVLCGAAVIGAALLASVTLRWLAPTIEQQLGRRVPGGLAMLSIDWRVMLVVGASALIVAIAVSMAPLLGAFRPAIFSSLRQSRSSATSGASGRRMRSTFIALEIAGSLSLLVGCGLLLRTVIAQLNVDLGIRTAGVVTAGLAMREQSYPTADRRIELFERVLGALEQADGASSVALSTPPPLASFEPDPIATGAGSNAQRMNATIRAVSANYFTTLGIPVAAGRSFSATDRGRSPPVAIVSATTARRLWSGASPLGRTMRMVEESESESDTLIVTRTVVGVASDVRQSPTDQDVADVYVPVLQGAGRFVTIVLRTAGPAGMSTAELRRRVTAVDSEVSVGGLQQLNLQAAQQLARPRFLAALFAGFGCFAAILGILGLYAVIAAAVKQREHEIAVRMAVGADRGKIVGLFMNEGGRLVAAGVALGALGAVAMGRLLEAQLFGVKSIDLTTLGIAALVLGAAAAAAIWWPALRASRTDPVVALRAE